MDSFRIFRRKSSHDWALLVIVKHLGSKFRWPILKEKWVLPVRPLQLLYRNVQRFRGGLALKAHVSRNSMLASNKEEEEGALARALTGPVQVVSLSLYTLSLSLTHTHTHTLSPLRDLQLAQALGLDARAPIFYITQLLA